MSPPAAQQIILAIKVILGEDGSNQGAQKLTRICENSNFFRSELQKMDLMNASNKMWLLLVLLLTRIRICISASHTRVDLINALEVISKDGDLVGIKSFPAGLKKDHEEDGMIKLDYVPEKIFHC
ncbi:hypothetical protein Nepgr_002953 [Nepenthes gracilis]|uniref:Uncharacterized protein n=1 Tax=Nepenthes gracilis TaxID=150966 RepID=A0AAD3RYM2_NEPGR|nr:hypothetical protein Nepgr_002953 [Nepenthes gracilis]